jgi:ABC-2 type transport system permease protein
MYTLMIPMGIVALVVIDGARSFAGEEQDQSIGMLAANPLSRTRILVEKSFGIIVHVLIVAVLVGLFVWAGSAAFGLGLDASHIWAASLHGALLGIMFGGLTALVSVATGKRVASMMIIGAMAVVFYLIASFFPIIETLADWAQISPWHFYYSSNPLANGVDWTHVGLMAGISAVLYLTAWYVFTKRDLPG